MMAHQRTRDAESLIAKALTYSPCVGIMGMRQVGKSTLIKKLAKSYFSFDDDSFLRRFENEKSALLEHSPPTVALDEIQKHPPAFDALKFSIDNKKQMGRFLVSGSVRFSSRKQIRESLTGRIVSFELLPLSLAECHDKTASPFLKILADAPPEKLADVLKRRAWATDDHLEHYLVTGGLPGICFRRDEKVRDELFEQHLDTLLNRDIRLVRQVRLSGHQLRDLVTAIAMEEGRPANLSQWARVAGCSLPTVKSTLEAMQGLFLVRPHGDTWFVEDAGLAHHLARATGRLAYNDMVRAAYHELRRQHLLYTRLEAAFSSYATRGGIDVPYFFTYKTGRRVAVLIDTGKTPSEKSLKSVTWLSKRFADFRAVILTRGVKALVLGRKALALPLCWIF